MLLDWQSIATGILIGIALAYVLVQVIQTWRGSGKGCGTGCGKCTSPSVEEKPTRNRIPLSQLHD